MLTIHSRPRARFRAAKRRLPRLGPYLFLLPSLILTLVFVVGPTLAGLGVSFTSWKLPGQPEFVGLENYLRMISDPRVAQSIGNTLVFAAVSVVLLLVVGFLLAAALDRRVRGIGFYRTAVITPLIVTPIAASTIWLWIYNPEVGLLNGVLGLFGIEGRNWLFSTTTAMPAVVVMSVWMEVGFTVIIFLAAFQTVPKEVMEAAELDGATQLQRWRHITAPLVAPTTLLLAMVLSIRGLQSFDQFYLLTQGGPLGSTRTLPLQIYETAFKGGQVGYASAMSWLLGIMVFGIVLAQWRLRKRWVHGEQ